MTTTQQDRWAGRKVLEARSIMANKLPSPCGQCGKEVTEKDKWVVGHVKSRITHPHLTWVLSNWRIEHKACSDKTGQAAVIEKAKFDALKSVGFVFPPEMEAGKPPLLPVHTHENHSQPLEVREGLSWANLCQNAPEWLQPYLEVPENASPPMWVTGVHPEAVGSYGPEALAWMTENLKERGKPLSLRWWQRLAVVLQLQHREDGTLCFRTILESGPRRIGKSVRLRAMALWRLENGPDLFEPEQLVLHTGKDLAIVREVMRKAWAWAGPRDDWSCKKGMTEPEVSYADVNRWVARSKDATTGYDACLALVDEAWDVKPASIDDDLEPTMLERESPQLVLTSTAHRRATSLMRGRILDALSVDDGETLVLIWGAPVGSDPADPAVWRAASPHWSDDRASMMSSKFAKAMAGETDPEFDDPDPMEGFKAQYLNMWRLRDRHVEHGSAVFTADQWETLTALLPDTRPDSAAVESWHAEGVSVALAWRSGLDTATVQVLDFPDTASAVAALKDSGFRGRATVGASLLEDPAFKNVRTTKGQGRPAASVQELARLVAEGQAMHDGGEHLTTQVLAARTTPGADGPRLVSKARGDAIKAAVWALTSARKARSGRPRILLPSSV